MTPSQQMAGGISDNACLSEIGKYYAHPFIRQGHELLTIKLSVGSGRSFELQGLQNPSLYEAVSERPVAL